MAIESSDGHGRPGVFSAPYDQHRNGWVAMDAKTNVLVSMGSFSTQSCLYALGQLLKENMFFLKHLTMANKKPLHIW